MRGVDAEADLHAGRGHYNWLRHWAVASDMAMTGPQGSSVDREFSPSKVAFERQTDFVKLMPHQWKYLVTISHNI